MENTTIANQSLGLNNESMDALSGGLEKTIEKTMDISKETERIVSMTPKDGYQKKIELISKADDMSPQEKLKAIDSAEDKYARDLEKNSDMCTKMMWTKVGLFLFCTAGAVLMITSPDGKRIAKSVIKWVA